MVWAENENEMRKRERERGSAGGKRKDGEESACSIEVAGCQLRKAGEG